MFSTKRFQLVVNVCFNVPYLHHTSSTMQWPGLV